MEQAEGRAAQRVRRGVRDEAGEQALAQRHVDAPQRDAREHGRDVGGPRQRDVGGRERGEARQKRRRRAGAIGPPAGGIGPKGVNDVHRHQRQRREADGEAEIMRAQHQKRLAEPREGEDDSEGRQLPEGAGQAREIDGANRERLRGRVGGGGAVLDAEIRHQHGERGRDDREPEHHAHVAGEQRHQRQREQRAEKGADGVERLAQSEGAAANLLRRDVGDEGVARRSAYAFADSVCETGGEHGRGRAGQRENGLRQRAESVTDQQQRFAAPKAVREVAGEHLDDGGGRFRDALQRADEGYRGAERHGEIKREQGVDHLRGDVHAQADEPERPDGAGDRGRGGHSSAPDGRAPAAGRGTSLSSREAQSAHPAAARPTPSTGRRRAEPLRRGHAHPRPR